MVFNPQEEDIDDDGGAQAEEFRVRHERIRVEPLEAEGNEEQIRGVRPHEAPNGSGPLATRPLQLAVRPWK